MYKWNDGRNFSGSKNLQALNLISKTFNPLIRNRFELNNFNRLPVIKEEEGNPNDDDLEIKQNLLRNVLRRNYKIKKGICSRDSNDEIKNYERVIESKSLTRLPPLVSINCFIDDDVNQAQVWESKYGRYLMNFKKSDEDLNSSGIKKKCNEKEKFGVYQSNRFFLRRKSFQEENLKNGVGDKAQLSQIKSNKKTSSVKDPNLKKKVSQEKVQPKKLLPTSLSVTSFHKSQHFLTESMQSVIEGHSKETNFKNANENLSMVEDLSRQKNQHDTDKEICLLCEKVFYNPQKFVQHLFTHEAVDKFSCKKCKINFLSLRKYKQHCKDFHVTSSEAVKNQSVDFVKKCLPKFECKRCKLAFDSEQIYKTHKRSHIKKELVEEYLISSKNTLNSN